MKNPYFPDPSERDSGHAVLFYVSNQDWWYLHERADRPRGQISAISATLYKRFLDAVKQLNLPPQDANNERLILALINTVTFEPGRVTLPPTVRPRPQSDDGRPAARDVSDPSGRTGESGNPRGKAKKTSASAGRKTGG